MEFAEAVSRGSYTIIASVDAMREKSIQLKQTCAELEECFTEARACMLAAERTWKAASSEALVSIYARTAADAEALSTRLSATASKLDKLIEMYESAEHSISEEMNKLPNTVFL